ncbi:MAG: hypothetical protein LBG13_01520 [Holosporales bacterium]|jgi:predicted transcriptional regulator|nr:hypothetical protein [Holosporales bacterium]
MKKLVVWTLLGGLVVCDSYASHHDGGALSREMYTLKGFMVDIANDYCEGLKREMAEVKQEMAEVKQGMAEVKQGMAEVKQGMSGLSDMVAQLLATRQKKENDE